MSSLIAFNLADTLRTLLLVLEIAIAIPLSYLVVLSVGAIAASMAFGRHRQTTEPARDAASAFAILVPAHDEELLIGKTLASLDRLEYPADRRSVYVIADNCTDRTASIARAAGADVYERTDTANRGKGYALAWAFSRLLAESTRYDAYVVIDADTVVDPLLLQALEKGLRHGKQALQSHNTVLNVSDSPTTALRWLALTLMNYVRPLGRNRIGGSSTLTGNGMCLTSDMLIRHPWRAFGLAEDYQYYLSVVQSGERIWFVPGAKVYSVMPTTVRQLQSQDIRWETLSPESSRRQRRVAWDLLAQGIHHHDPVRLDACAELLTPPLSVLVGGTFLVLLASLALAGWWQVILSVFLVLALLTYVSSALVLLRPPKEVYTALVHAPAYVLRKLWIYFVLRRLRKNTTTWVRTPRAASAGTKNKS